MKTIIQLLLLTALVTSCATSNHVNNNSLIQKRKYNRGWHTGGMSKFKSSKKKEVILDIQPEKKKMDKVNDVSKLNTTTSRGKEPAQCDTIYYVNGEIEIAEVLGFGDKYVGVKTCNTSKKMRAHNIPKAKIKKIYYSYKAEENPNERPALAGPPKSGAIVSYIFATVGLLLSIIFFILVGLELFYLIGAIILLLVAIGFIVLGTFLNIKSKRLKKEFIEYKSERGLRM